MKILGNSGFGEHFSLNFNISLKIEFHGVKFDTVNLSSGDFQGDHISLLLFLIYNNNVNRTLKHTWLFAFYDDLKLFLCANYIDCCKRFQIYLNNIVTWWNILSLQLNISKRLIMTFTRHRNSIHFLYTIHSFEFPQINIATHGLGLSICSSINYNLKRWKC